MIGIAYFVVILAVGLNQSMLNTQFESKYLWMFKSRKTIEVRIFNLVLDMRKVSLKDKEQLILWDVRLNVSHPVHF